MLKFRNRGAQVAVSALLMLTLQCGYGLLFLASGMSKWLRQRSVRLTVANYRLMPSRIVPVFAALLAIVETAAGILLILALWLPPVYPLAWWMATGLLSLFSLAIATALVRGFHIPCGCGLLLNGHTITPATLVRNAMLLLPLLLPLLSSLPTLAARPGAQ